MAFVTDVGYGRPVRSRERSGINRAARLVCLPVDPRPGRSDLVAGGLDGDCEERPAGVPQPGGPVHELGRRAELRLPGVVHRRGEVEQRGLHVVLLRLGLGASPLAETDLGQEKLGEAGAGVEAGEGALDGAGEEAREGAEEGAGVGAEGAQEYLLVVHLAACE